MQRCTKDVIDMAVVAMTSADQDKVPTFYFAGTCAYSNEKQKVTKRRMIKEEIVMV